MAVSLFTCPVSSKVAYKNFCKSVMHRQGDYIYWGGTSAKIKGDDWETQYNAYSKYLEQQQLTIPQLKKKLKQFKANISKSRFHKLWYRMSPGDYIVFIKDGDAVAAGLIVKTYYDPEGIVSTQVEWDAGPDRGCWDLVVKMQYISCKISNFAEHIGATAHDVHGIYHHKSDRPYVQAFVAQNILQPDNDSILITQNRIILPRATDAASFEKKDSKRARFEFDFNEKDYPDIFDELYHDMIESFSESLKDKPELMSTMKLSDDHKVSVDESFWGNYDPHYIKHPRNFVPLSSRLNSIKGSKSSLTYSELIKRVDKYEEFHGRFYQKKFGEFNYGSEPIPLKIFSNMINIPQPPKSSLMK